MKNILIAITGSISAYKIPELCRLLIKKKYNIKIILTKSGAQFVAPLTLKTLTNDNLFMEDSLENINQKSLIHIELAKWADAILIAPSTANIIAKLAMGLADDLLTSTILATNAPIIIAPSMNKNMWENIATQNNCKSLKKRNIQIIAPEYGEQACGDIGEGRLANINNIADLLDMTLFKHKILNNKNIIITAGATVEEIDPVRYITNHSSGKMGYYLAKAARNMGANVTLISSNTVNLEKIYGINTIYVKTAEEMLNASVANIKNTDIYISAAAICDWKLENIATNKLKKSTDKLVLDLIQTTDVIKTIANNNTDIFVVGFAAETENIKQNANQKLINKNLDMIILNNVNDKNIGFYSEENSVDIITKTTEKHVPICPKNQLSYIILKEIYLKFSKNNNE